MTLNDIIKTLTRDKQIYLPIAIWLFLTLTIHKGFQNYPQILKHIPTIQKQTTLELIFSSFLLIAALVYVCWHLKRKLKTKPDKDKYWYFQNPGLYVDPKTREIFCNKCFTDGFLSQVSLHQEKGLICRRCNNWYCDLQEYPRLINKINNFKA